MESVEKQSFIIASNISAYRKAIGLTQAELAQKLGYSDKSISKWEQGNGVPDIFIMIKLSEIFGVTVDDLIKEHTEPVKAPKKKWLDLTNKNLIMILSSGVSWLITVMLFVILKLALPNQERLWLAFIYAVPVTFVVLLVFSCIWHFRLFRFICISAVVWTLLLSVYLTTYPADNFALIFIIGAVAQVLVIISYFLTNNILKKMGKIK